jgi:hypothetical protein
MLQFWNIKMASADYEVEFRNVTSEVMRYLANVAVKRRLQFCASQVPALEIPPCTGYGIGHTYPEHGPKAKVVVRNGVPANITSYEFSEFDPFPQDLNKGESEFLMGLVGSYL